MKNFLVLALSGLVTLGLAGWLMPESPGSVDDDPPPPEKKKGEPAKKDDPGPEGDLRRAYDLLRRIKSDDGPNGRADERLRDWTGRAVVLYRRGLDALAADHPHEAHELGVAAHDLARAVDHTRNAARFEHNDPDLPPPPGGPGRVGNAGQPRRDLRRAFDRIAEMDDGAGPDLAFYRDGARDLYTAARRDAEEGRPDRAGELARAAEALTHVPEHLARAGGPPPDPKAEAKKKGHPPDPKKKDGPKAGKADRPDDDELPPPLAPRG